MDPLQLMKGIKMDRSEHQNIDHFNSVADEYDFQYQQSIANGLDRAKFIAKHSKHPLQSDLALDLGCGTGNLSIGIIRTNLSARCVGIDISYRMISQAKKKSSSTEGIHLNVGSALHLPYADNTFDLIVADAFLHHILDVRKTLIEIYRVLKPGACATFNEPSLIGYSFLELIFKSIYSGYGEIDPALEGYLYFLQFLRENAGNLQVLEAMELPDKHFFSAASLEGIAREIGFKDTCICPSQEYYKGLWKNACASIMHAVEPAPELAELVIEAGEWIDSLIGESALEIYCLHQQSYFYK
jgi:demethylmenaquinone methyltransferase/2-methoxy-6-polyprenyl-1,4-benzoquinol methylase